MEKNRRPHLYIDVSVIARMDAGTGIQRVVREVWGAISTDPDSKFEVVPVAGSAKKQYRVVPKNFLRRPLARLPWRFGKARLSPCSGDVFLGLDLASHVAPRNAAQLKKWRDKGVKLAFVVYDLLPIQHPEWFTERNIKHFHNWLELITRQAHLLVCISRTVAGDLQDWMAAKPIDNPPIIATMRLGAFGGAKPSMAKLYTEDAATVAWAREGTCVMMVGTIEPRKGHEQVLRAFESLWAKPEQGEDFRLLIVGRPGWKTEKLQQTLRLHPQQRKRLRWIDNADDALLAQLYRSCWGVLLASHGEGFGLPLLEAATYHKPLLARDLNVFREIAPPGVAYFSDDAPIALVQKIRSWHRLANPVEADPQNSSWSRTAADLQELLGMLHARP